MGHRLWQRSNRKVDWQERTSRSRFESRRALGIQDPGARPRLRVTDFRESVRGRDGKQRGTLRAQASLRPLCGLAEDDSPQPPEADSSPYEAPTSRPYGSATDRLTQTFASTLGSESTSRGASGEHWTAPCSAPRRLSYSADTRSSAPSTVTLQRVGRKRRPCCMWFASMTSNDTACSRWSMGVGAALSWS